MDIQWDIQFKQWKPPTEDKVTQINIGIEENPKPIFISKSLAPLEKEDLVTLIREYIDVSPEIMKICRVIRKLPCTGSISNHMSN